MKRIISLALACLMLAAFLVPSASAEGGLVLAEGSHLVLGETYVEKIDGAVTVDELKAEFAGEVDVAGKGGTAQVATDDSVTAGAESLRALIYGDVNRDGKISVTDVTSMLKKIAAWDVDVNTDAADVDANGKLTVSDVTKMLKYLAKWDDISLGNVRMVFENVKVAAEKENKNLDAFFSSTMQKIFREQTDNTGEYAYKIRLARNEYESCQFYLTTKEAYEGMTIDVAPLEYEYGGHTLEVKVEKEYYWEAAMLGGMYVKGKEDVHGYMPEALLPNLSSFELVPGNLQGFMITVKADKEAPAGMYKSYVTVKDADGNEVKKAAIFAKVWDFTLPDTPYSASAFGLGWGEIYGYEHMYDGDDSVTSVKYYEFMLENNLSQYDLPYEAGDILDDRNDKYMSDPRVTSFCISAATSDDNYHFIKSDEYLKASYEKLASNPDWLDKGYFYPVDEPYAPGLHRVRVQYERLRTLLGEDAYLNIVVPLASNSYADSDAQIKNIDAVELIRPYITIWCPQSAAFGRYDAGNKWTSRQMYVKYGDFEDRWQTLKAEAHKGWWYICIAPQPPYPNYFMIYNGIGNRVVAWQQYLYDCDGILYWSTTADWKYVTMKSLNMQKWEFGYGDGLLLYYGKLFGLAPGPIASWRLYQIRDGFDDFDYMHLVEEAYGEGTAMKIVNKVTTDIFTFTEDYRVMEAARDELASLLEGTDK